MAKNHPDNLHPADNSTNLLKAEIRRLRKELSNVTPSLEIMLKRRGFIPYKKEPSDDLLLPDKKYRSAFYSKLKNYSFRLFIRDVIQRQDAFTLDEVTRYTTREVSAQYLNFLMNVNLTESSGNGYCLSKRPVKSFGTTLEWFVSRLVTHDFHAEAIWGATFRRPGVGGDYDLIAKIDSALLFMEIKSSPPRQIYESHITAFFNRIEDLSPDISIFFVDTELRMKDKIVPMFEDAVLQRYKAPLPVERIKKELFHINKKIFIINAKGGISANIKTVLTFFWHKKIQIP